MTADHEKAKAKKLKNNEEVEKKCSVASTTDSKQFKENWGFEQRGTILHKPLHNQFFRDLKRKEKKEKKKIYVNQKKTFK